MSLTEDIKSRLDLVEFVAETVKLKKSGSSYKGFCPFHKNTDTEAFAVFPNTQVWKCFGACNDGGDIFKFVMKRDGVDFGEALRILAARAGVELKPRTPAEQAQDDNLDHLREALESAATYYHHLLKNAPQAQAARTHLQQRGLTEKAVEIFQLGYALDSWEAASKFLLAKGFQQPDLIEAGLSVEKEAGKFFDRFRDRLMIPVRDEQGRLTGFQARALKADAQPKFMNSPQTALFDKGRTVFGLSLAKKAIRDANTAIVVEGNLDVIAAHQAGFANVVSSQGTALTEHQLRLVKKYAKRIVLALDADEAGASATLRGLNVAREALEREADFVFDPHGWVKTEARLGADLRVMTLPAGLDPDEVIKRDPIEWQRLVETAEPVVAYVIRVMTEGRNLDDPKLKVEIATAILPLIEDVAQPIERDSYRQKLARVLRVDDLRVLATRPTPTKRATPPSPSRPASAPAGRDRDASQLEEFCLGVLLQRPELLYKADRELQTLGLAKLIEGDFLTTEHQLIFEAVQKALEQFEADPADHVRDSLDGTLKARADGLMRAVRLPNTAEDKLPGELLTTVLRLRRRTVQHWLRELRFLAEGAREQGDARAEAFQQEISQQATALAQVDRALARRNKRLGESPRLGV